MGSRDLRRFVIAVARAASQSEQLLEIVGDCAAALSTPSDEEVHRIVHYCLCLHLITQELAASPELARHVLKHQQVALRSEQGWWKHLSAFEHAKLITLERALVFFGYHRAKASEPSHLPIPANFGRVGLPFNIFEAVLQDAVFYRQSANAWAGVPLILARPGRAGRPAELSPDSRRAVRMHLPQPDAWKDLYVSWNLAFTANYQDAPYFSAALFCPCILGASPDEFMYHRTFALHLHASAQIRARSRLGVGPGGRVQAERDWAQACRRAGLVSAWGDRNLRAAHEYYAACAPALGWITTAWHRQLALPLLQRQIANLDGATEGATTKRGVVVPTARPSAATPPVPLPLAGDTDRSGAPALWPGQIGLATNVVGLAASIVTVAPFTLLLVVPALAEAAFAAGTTGAL